MTVVGIDPGLANLGLGAIREDGRDALYLGAELVRTQPRTPQAERLRTLYEHCKAFFVQHQPAMIALEGQYFHHQRELAFKVGQAVGVCLLAAHELEIPTVEYGPMQVKQALVGSGRAGKDQVAYMVRAMLSLKAAPESHHVADALALALTHLSFRRIKDLASY